MDPSRRVALGTCVGGIASLLLTCQSGFAQNRTPGLPQPTNRRREPATADEGEGPNPASATKALLEQRQKGIKKDVEKLFDLATELKNEVEKTDATAVLSMAMVKKTEEIEKLAKQIRDSAKG
jgi:hypothetical protein